MFDLFYCHNLYSKVTYNFYFNQFPLLNYKCNMYSSRKTIQPTNKNVTRRSHCYSPNCKSSSLIDNHSSLSTKSMNVNTTIMGGKDTCIIVKDDISNVTVSTQDTSIFSMKSPVCTNVLSTTETTKTSTNQNDEEQNCEEDKSPMINHDHLIVNKVQMILWMKKKRRVRSAMTWHGARKPTHS